jgi:hypothetical protein
MRSRYLQVALTYTRPAFFRGWALVMGAYLLWLITRTSANLRIDVPLLITGVTLVTWFGAMVTSHAKEQLADSRAALTPGFRGPHLLVAGIILVIGVTLLPAIIVAQYTRLDPPWGWPRIEVSWAGYLTLLMLVTAAMAWMTHLQSPLAVTLTLGGGALLATSPGMRFVQNILEGRQRDVANVVLSVSVTAIVLLFWRLSRMHEEMAEYARITSAGLRLKVAMTGDRVFRREARADSTRVEEFIRATSRLDQVKNVYDAGFWRRVQHWRAVVGLGRAPIFVAVMLAIWTFTLPLIVSDRSSSRYIIAVALATMVPGLMVTAIWPRRWYVLADESLRPATRRRFLLEQCTAMALELFAAVALITTAVLLATMLLGAVSPIREAVPPSNVWRALPVLVAGQILVFGINLWILRFRAGWVILLPMIATTCISAPLLIAMALLDRRGGWGDSLLVALILAVTGLGITFDAGRRWIVTEFD